MQTQVVADLVGDHLGDHLLTQSKREQIVPDKLGNPVAINKGEAVGSVLCGELEARYHIYEKHVEHC